jgi:hypothetical protein
MLSAFFASLVTNEVLAAIVSLATDTWTWGS